METVDTVVTIGESYVNGGSLSELNCMSKMLCIVVH